MPTHTIMNIPIKAMNTNTEYSASTVQASLAQLRLMQLISPSLPIGSFTYSQGLESAVDAEWIKDIVGLKQWLKELLKSTVTRVDLPILIRLYDASQKCDLDALQYWSDYLLACRETSELRQEEINRGRALVTLLKTLELINDDNLGKILSGCQSAGFAYAANQWLIPKINMLHGFVWSWLENLVLAGVKIIPLGQSDGQKILYDLAVHIPEITEKAKNINDDEIGSSNPALSIISSQHQFQYTRLYRS